MPDFESRFVWYELMTTDIPAASAFYRAVVGWGARPGPAPGEDYTIVTAGESWIAGLTHLPDTMAAAGRPPSWIGYVCVADLDDAAARASGLGATIRVAPTDITNIGRFAVITDPLGTLLALFQPPPGRQGPIRDARAAGHVGWHELGTTDRTRAYDFYSALFGWTKSASVDIGAMGTYQIVRTPSADLGGMYNIPAGGSPPGWLYYVNVGEIDAAAARVAAGGGAILNGPIEVPGGGWVVQCHDPQGAMFALLGTRVA